MFVIHCYAIVTIYQLHRMNAPGCHLQKCYMYSVSPKKYPYNNRIISIEGTFLGDTLYISNKTNVIFIWNKQTFIIIG
jgi:hypothetical protein